MTSSTVCVMSAAGGTTSGTGSSQDNTALDAAGSSGLYVFGGNSSTELVVEGGGEEVPLLRLFFPFFFSYSSIIGILTLLMVRSASPESGVALLLFLQLLLCPPHLCPCSYDVITWHCPQCLCMSCLQGFCFGLCYFCLPVHCLHVCPHGFPSLLFFPLPNMHPRSRKPFSPGFSPCLPVANSLSLWTWPTHALTVW